MATLTKTRQPRKPSTQAVHGSARWIGNPATQGQLDNGDAVLQITAAGKQPGFYFVTENKDNDGRRIGFRLVKIDGLEHTATYDVETIHGEFRCDCPDAIYSERPNGCKHAAGLKAALTAAKLI